MAKKKTTPSTPPKGGGRSTPEEVIEGFVTKATPGPDELLRAACAKQGVEPESLASFKVYPDKVVIVLGDYRKFSYSYDDLIGFFWKGDAPANTLKK